MQLSAHREHLEAFFAFQLLNRVHTLWQDTVVCAVFSCRHKYIISVVDMQQEDAHYCLPEKDLAVIGAYIKETAAAFALEKSEVQPAL